ncbi:hypothetical protein KUTeg_015631 [Tegillarca granosa]|uniref:Uncharacterized protein n=1 Tax=Tegillarca granosa TaxID=220873 RepID=A0ABQ9EUA8_TEGGR|nr:hypothetical protein KUTeg_015631 [Tegillarca granosa]
MIKSKIKEPRKGKYRLNYDAVDITKALVMDMDTFAELYDKKLIEDIDTNTKNYLEKMLMKDSPVLERANAVDK